MNNRNLAKIFFRLERDEDGYPPEDVEAVWAIPQADGYQIDNIPFFVHGIALGDVVGAEEADDGGLEFDGRVIRRSGHSTYRILLKEKIPGDPEKTIVELEAMGLGVESDIGLFAVDVPPEVPLQKVRDHFFERVDSGAWEVEEAYWADGHTQ